MYVLFLASRISFSSNGWNNVSTRDDLSNFRGIFKNVTLSQLEVRVWWTLLEVEQINSVNLVFNAGDNIFHSKKNI